MNCPVCKDIMTNINWIVKVKSQSKDDSVAPN